jgi:hypothetical protein
MLVPLSCKWQKGGWEEDDILQLNNYITLPGLSKTDLNIRE